MADEIVAVARFQTPTSTGNVNWTTTDLGGVTPKAAVFFSTRAITDGAEANNISFAYGFTDGTLSSLSGLSSEHGVGSTDTDRLTSANDCVAAYDSSGSPGTLYLADHSAWITNGITLNFSTVDASNQYFVTAVFFAGDDISVDCGKIDIGNQDVEINVTAPGFEPDLVLFSGAGTGSTQIGGANTRAFLGAAHNGVSISQSCAGWDHDHGDSVSAPSTYWAADRCGAVLKNQNLSYTVEAANFDSSGFSVFPRGGNGGNEDVYYLALKFTDVAAWVGEFDLPTATGNASVTGLGFTPQFALQMMGREQTYDAISTDADVNSYGVGVFTDNAEFCNAITDDDGNTTTDNSTISDNQAVNIVDPSGALFAATHVSMDSGGWTLNYSTVDGTTRKAWGLAIEATGGGGGGGTILPQMMHHHGA